MRYSKLRIAWSVLWGLVAVLLVVLWVRSYWWGESYTIRIKNTTACCSDLRGCIVATYWDASQRTDLQTGYSWGPARGQRIHEHFPLHFYGFYATKMPSGAGVVVPIWFLILAKIGYTVVPWLRWRFSVRSLFITTTLVALTLGVCVWLSY